MIDRIPGKKRREEIALLIIGQALSVAFSLIGVKLFTVYMPSSTYGQFALLLTLQTASVQLIYGPIGNACLRFSANAASKKTRNEILYAALLMASAASGITLAASLVASCWAQQQRSENLTVALALAALYSIVFGLIHIVSQSYNADRNRAAFSLTGAGLSGCQMILGLACILIFGSKLNSLILGYLLASLIVFSAGLAYSHKVYNLEPIMIYASLTSRSCRWMVLIKKIYSYAIHFSRWGFFTMIYISSDRWALGLTHGASSVGIYSVAYQLCYAPVAIVGGIIMQYISPALFQASHSSKSRHSRNCRARQILTLGIVACLTCGIIGSLLSPYIISLLANAQYKGPRLLGPFLAMAAAIGSSAELMGLLYQKDLRVGQLARIKIFSAILCIGLNIYLAKNFGALGVSMSLGIFGLTQIALMMIQRRRF